MFSNMLTTGDSLWSPGAADSKEGKAFQWHVRQILDTSDEEEVSRNLALVALTRALVPHASKIGRLTSGISDLESQLARMRSELKESRDQSAALLRLLQEQGGPAQAVTDAYQRLCAEDGKGGRWAADRILLSIENEDWNPTSAILEMYGEDYEKYLERRMRGACEDDDIRFGYAPRT